MKSYLIAGAVWTALMIAGASTADAWVCHAVGKNGARTWGRSSNLPEAKGLALGRCNARSHRCWITSCN